MGKQWFTGAAVRSESDGAIAFSTQSQSPSTTPLHFTSLCLLSGYSLWKVIRKDLTSHSVNSFSGKLVPVPFSNGAPNESLTNKLAHHFVDIEETRPMRRNETRNSQSPRELFPPEQREVETLGIGSKRKQGMNFDVFATISVEFRGKNTKLMVLVQKNVKQNVSRKFNAAS
ncbi:hypothetical protein K438DRAFT_1782469 [Mycena galopus ATCC 62051]|nr:hypothetical protein K438DRAFT_1782469 [Mycena galopus ATCC 62051]